MAVLATAALFGAVAAPAAAVEPPTCTSGAFLDRPGIARFHQLNCERTERAQLARAPAHGTLTGLTADRWGTVNWTYRPSVDAPAEDSFALRLDGPNGEGVHEIAVSVKPLAENTPPQCAPLSLAQRTDGTAPVTLETHAECWDDDGDSYTIRGGGPGTHLDAPYTVRGGNNGGTEVPWWHYRTAISNGQESTTYWATDDVGARSADAAISVQIGPGVDRLPWCQGNPGWAPDGQDAPIPYRVGMTRRFAIICRDADQDDIPVRLGRTPSDGTLTRFAPGGLGHFWDGSERWIDGVYEPLAGSTATDPFSVIAGSAGRTAEMPFAFVEAGSGNGGNGCGRWEAVTTPNTPGLVTLHCDDAESDPLTAVVTRTPEHGTAAPPAIKHLPYGVDEITIAWTPDRDFVGIDRMDVMVKDDHGMEMLNTVDLRVLPLQAPPADLGLVLPTAPVQGRPSVGQAPPVTPANQARIALRTRKVVLMRRLLDARVYARRETLKRGLAPVAGRAALAVTCPMTCRLAARVRAARSRVRATARPGRAATLKLSHGSARVLRRAGRAAFDVSVRMPGGRSARGTVKLKAVTRRG